MNFIENGTEGRAALALIAKTARRIAEIGANQEKEQAMKQIDINFNLPANAFEVKQHGGKYYVSDINGQDFNFAQWEEICKWAPRGHTDSYHPSILFATKGEALVQAELARLDCATYKVKEMRSNRAINREQYLDAIARLTAKRDMLEMGDE